MKKRGVWAQMEELFFFSLYISFPSQGLQGSNCKWQHCQIFQCPFGGELFIHICTVTRRRHLRATDCSSRATWQSYDSRKERRRQREEEGLGGDQNERPRLRWEEVSALAAVAPWRLSHGGQDGAPLTRGGRPQSSPPPRLHISLNLRRNDSLSQWHLWSSTSDIAARLSFKRWCLIQEERLELKSLDFTFCFFSNYQHARRTDDYNIPPQPSSPRITME